MPGVDPVRRSTPVISAGSFGPAQVRLVPAGLGSGGAIRTIPVNAPTSSASLQWRQRSPQPNLGQGVGAGAAAQTNQVQHTKSDEKGAGEGAVEEEAKNDNIESVSCFKCKVCGVLALTYAQVEEHLLLAHDTDESSGNRHNTDNWLPVAQKEGIKLACPHCPNLFNSKSSRSFRLHLIDDHGLNEEMADKKFSECHQKRKSATLNLLRERRDAALAESKNPRNQDSLEAYINEDGELRVRRSGSHGQQPLDEDITVNEDVSASEFIASCKASKKGRGGEGAKSSRNVDNTVPRRKTIGRPRGSRSIGITKLRRAHPGVLVSDHLMGVKCGVNDCAVRLKQPENLALHRRCHNEDSFDCPECKERFPFWSKLALHLWRHHRLDLELFACPECDNFRCFSRARLRLHQTSHRGDRPFLCDDCGKGFKTEKNLRVHQRLHVSTGGDAAAVALETCTVCERTFKEKRLLKLHMAAVHEKLKPHLCNFCGYSGMGDKCSPRKRCSFSSVKHLFQPLPSRA